MYIRTHVRIVHMCIDGRSLSFSMTDSLNSECTPSDSLSCYMEGGLVVW